MCQQSLYFIFGQELIEKPDPSSVLSGWFGVDVLGELFLRNMLENAAISHWYTNKLYIYFRTDKRTGATFRQAESAVRGMVNPLDNLKVTRNSAFGKKIIKTYLRKNPDQIIQTDDPSEGNDVLRMDITGHEAEPDHDLYPSFFESTCFSQVTKGILFSSTPDNEPQGLQISGKAFIFFR